MAETYNEKRLIELDHCCVNPAVSHLGHAALFLEYLFELKKIPAIFFGGWAMFLRGSGRIPKGISMTVICSMETLASILAPEHRLFLPSKYKVTDHQMIVFLKTGGIYNPHYEERTIKARLIEFGWYGTPANFQEGADIIMPTSSTAGTRPVRVVSVYFMTRHKLDAFWRHGRNEDFADLVFLVKHYHSFIYPIRERLSRYAAKYFARRFAEDYPCWYQRIYEVEYTFGLPIGSAASGVIEESSSEDEST